MQDNAFCKVAVFIARRSPGVDELLTFVHPLAGRQLPAGSVELHETAETAANREVFKETGLRELQDLMKIGEGEKELSGQAIAFKEIILIDGDGWRIDKVKRGHYVRIDAVCGERILVHRLVYDFSSEPPRELSQPKGWADANVFGNRIQRSFFLARAPNDGRTGWIHNADGYSFRIEWKPLYQGLGLIDGQSNWLEAHIEIIRKRLAAFS